MSCFSCDACLVLSFPWCEDILFVVGVTPSTQYHAIVTAPNGIKYTQTVTSDTGGAIELDIDGFPEELFNPYAGIFTLEMETTAGDEVTMVNGYTDYTCVSFDIYKLTDAN
jgi:hypothetical protein